MLKKLYIIMKTNTVHNDESKTVHNDENKNYT